MITSTILTAVPNSIAYFGSICSSLFPRDEELSYVRGEGDVSYVVLDVGLGGFHKFISCPLQSCKALIQNMGKIPLEFNLELSKLVLVKIPNL